MVGFGSIVLLYYYIGTIASVPSQAGVQSNLVQCPTHGVSGRRCHAGWHCIQPVLNNPGLNEC